MRVTKTIREYIEKKVDEALMVKYSAEKAEADRQCKVKENIISLAAERAEKIFLDTIHEEAVKHDFLEIYEDREPHFFYSQIIGITDYCYTNSVHKWQSRKRDEKKEIVDNIVVSLELGGTKADLDKMLSELAHGAD